MRLRRAGLVGLSAVLGAGSMVLELASVRALAPHFGASTEIWTTAIGVVLLALAAGYGIGGRLSERPRPMRALGVAASAAGLLAAAAPWALRPLAGWMVPGDLSLEDALPILRGGSLVAETLLFGPPILLLGLAGPLVVRSLADAGLAPGRAAGWALASSTIGGLAGTFGTTYLLIPQCGVRWTLLGTGLALGTLGTAILGFDRRSPAAASLAFMAAGLSSASAFLRAPSPRAPLPPGARLVEERESREQYLRVVDWPATPDRERWLQASEGLDSYQSLDAPGRRTPGAYYDVLALAPAYAGIESGARTAVVGSGAGSVVRSLLEFDPEAKVVGFELDPTVVELGRRDLRLAELEAKGATILGGVDGRIGLARSAGPLDAVLIDAYARQVEIPFHLVTREMLEIAGARLAPGGVVAVNVSSFGPEDPVLRAIAATLASAVGEPVILPVRHAHNAIALARKGRPMPPPESFLARMRKRGDALLIAHAQLLAGPGGAEPFALRESDVVLDDDRAPMERLQAASLAAASRARR